MKNEDEENDVILVENQKECIHQEKVWQMTIWSLGDKQIDQVEKGAEKAWSGRGITLLSIEQHPSI